MRITSSIQCNCVFSERYCGTYHPAEDVTRVSVMPRKVTLKIGDDKNRCR